MNRFNTPLLFILSLFFTITTFSQNTVIDRTFSSGFTANSNDMLYYTHRLDDINDSLLSYLVGSKDTGSTVKFGVRYTLSKSDLAINRIDTVWNLNKLNVANDLSQNFTSVPINFFLKDDRSNVNFIFEAYIDTNYTQHCSIYSADNDYLKGNIVGSFNQQFESLVNDPFIYDNMIHTFSVDSTRDSTVFKIYDLSGQLLRLRTYAHNFFANDPLIGGVPVLAQSILVHPTNDSLLILPYYTYGYGIQIINRYTMMKKPFVTLDGVQGANLTNTMGWLTKFPSSYAFYNNSFVMAGYCSQFRSLPSLEKDFAMFKIEMDYNGQVLKAEEFGSDTVDERTYEYVVKNNAEYYVGSSPCRIQGYYAREYRKLMVLKQSSTYRDSLLFYGDKNHLGMDLLIDDNDDVFALSQYSNAWTDDSIFTVITKIPNSFLIGIKENNPQITSVRVFPNPTMDLLKVDGAENGDSYRVVSISGQLMQEGILTNEKSINVAALKQGSYILQLGSQQQTYRANVFIKQ